MLRVEAHRHAALDHRAIQRLPLTTAGTGVDAPRLAVAVGRHDDPAVRQCLAIDQGELSSASANVQQVLCEHLDAGSGDDAEGVARLQPQDRFVCQLDEALISDGLDFLDDVGSVTAAGYEHLLTGP